jgi:hypothetical protein
MPRRFDTPFFIAVVPKDQECSPDFRETTEGLWSRPRDALAKNLTGEIPLSPSTLVTLQELLRYSDPLNLRRDLLDRRWGSPFMARLMVLEKGAGTVIMEPWDPFYSQEDYRFEIDQLKRSLLPVGEPFSRLWNHDGIWRPVGFTSLA